MLVAVVTRRCQRLDRLSSPLAWLKVPEKSETRLPVPRPGHAASECTDVDIEFRVHNLTVIHAGA